MIGVVPAKLVSKDHQFISPDNPLPVSAVTSNPENFVYSFLTRISGPQAASTNDVDMNTNSSLATPSIFEYEANVLVKIRRLNFEIVDGGMQNQRFAGLAAALTNGCLFEVIDEDGNTQILDFLNGNPLTMNSDFSILAGVDSVVFAAPPGEDILPVRFTIEKAGTPMRLAAGRRIRWTNRDNLSTITRFRAMAQGTLV